MAKLLPDLVQFIIANHLATADGTDIFRDFTPDIPNKLVVLYNYDSKLPLDKGNEACVQYVQVVCRDINPTAAKDAADLLFRLFFRYDEEISSLPNNRWAIILPKQTPFKINVDDQNRYTYGFNMAITTYID